MAEIKKGKLDSSKYDGQRIELTEEQLDAISGGVWRTADSVATNQAWDNAFNSDAWVVWREPGVGDHWCHVNGYVYSGNAYITFDLDCPAENFYATGVPANEVLFDCAF